MSPVNVEAIGIRGADNVMWLTSCLERLQRRIHHGRMESVRCVQQPASDAGLLKLCLKCLDKRRLARHDARVRRVFCSER